MTEKENFAKAETDFPTYPSKKRKRAKVKAKGAGKPAAKKGPSKSGFRPDPRVPLEKSLQVAQAIKNKNGGNPWTGDQIANVIGISDKGVGFTYFLLSSKKFGLTEGAKAKGQVSLTPLGREIVYSGSPEEETAAKRKAFLSVDIFRQVLEFYDGNKLPEMQYLGNTLQNKFHLHSDFHEEFAILFRQNCEFVGLQSGLSKDQVDVQQNTGSDVIVLSENASRSGLVCFVIMPFIEKSGLFARGFFDEVLNCLITPAAREAGFEVKTANRQGTEIIHSTIINEILDSDICVCDLTEHNPNVLFELGMRLAHDKPVALIHAEGTGRVFDVDNVLRVLDYKKELWPTTLRKNVPDLTAHIRATWENREKSESYYKVLRSTRLRSQAKAAGA
jgi:hypothetical protein